MLFDLSSVIMIQRQRNKTNAMTTIERISMMIISFKIFNSRRKYIRIYRYMRTYGSLPLLQEIENKKKSMNFYQVEKKENFLLY